MPLSIIYPISHLESSFVFVRTWSPFLLVKNLHGDTRAKHPATHRTPITPSQPPGSGECADPARHRPNSHLLLGPAGEERIPIPLSSKLEAQFSAKGRPVRLFADDPLLRVYRVDTYVNYTHRTVSVLCSVFIICASVHVPGYCARRLRFGLTRSFAPRS